MSVAKWFRENQAVVDWFRKQDRLLYNEYKEREKENEDYLEMELMHKISKLKKLRPCPMDLLSIPDCDPHWITTNTEFMFSKKQHEMSKLVLPARYVLLTIIYDKRLKDDPRKIHQIGTDIWGHDATWVKFIEDIWKTIIKKQDDSETRLSLTQAFKEVEFNLQKQKLIPKADLAAQKSAASEVGQEKIHINLSQWNESKSRNLMQDLLSDEFREGVKISPRRHGPQQPGKLKRLLSNDKHKAGSVADKIIKIERDKHKLDIPFNEITYIPPKT